LAAVPRREQLVQHIQLRYHSSISSYVATRFEHGIFQLGWKHWRYYIHGRSHSQLVLGYWIWSRHNCKRQHIIQHRQACCFYARQHRSHKWSDNYDSWKRDYNYDCTSPITLFRHWRWKLGPSRIWCYHSC
jgi:hypothetical protein